MKTTSATTTAPHPSILPISPELRRLLEDDILKRGVMVPILVAHDGEVIDGRLRHEIATEYGLPACSAHMRRPRAANFGLQLGSAAW